MSLSKSELSQDQNISTMKLTLLCKWNWRYANEKGSLWKKVIIRKYGEEVGRWCNKEVGESYGVGL